MRSLQLVNVYFHPEITMVQAQEVAEGLGCCLTWRGNRFVMRRVRQVPKRHARTRPLFR